MIIQSLKARHFMRFEKLDLADIPKDGLVGIFGSNESGKSSIGELICFCMFGRTTGAPDGDAARIVRWRQDSANVEMEFARKGVEYRVTRRISRDGTSDARLIETASNEPLATTPNQVEEVLTNLLGYSFKEFRYSTFIAQNELDIILRSADDRREVLNNMLGVGFMEKMAAKIDRKRDDREKELNSVRQRLDDKQEVMAVYSARKKDMDRVIARLDRAGDSMLARIKDRDDTQATVDLLVDTRRRYNLLQEVDYSIKKKRERLKQVEERVAELLEHADRVPGLKGENETKRSLIKDIMEVRKKALDEKYVALERYHEFHRRFEQIQSQLDLKKAARSEITEKIKDINEKEEELEKLSKELVEVSQFVDSYRGADDFRLKVSNLERDVELVRSELDKVRITLTKDIEIVTERERAFATQQDRISRQIKAATVQSVDRDQLQKVQKSERSASISRDVAFGTGGVCMLGGVVLTLVLGNIMFLLVLLGMLPTWGVALYFQSRVRAIGQEQQHLQQQLYAYNISQRGIVELQESTDDVSQHLKALKDEIQSSKIKTAIFSHLKTLSFKDLSEAIELLDGQDVNELERARSLMVDVLNRYADLRRFVDDDSVLFEHMAKQVDPDAIMKERRKELDSLAARISELEEAVGSREHFLEQSGMLDNNIENLQNVASEIESEMTSQGVTDDDVPDMQHEETAIKEDVERIQMEIDRNLAEIAKIEMQAEEASRLEVDRKKLISEIDDSLIKYYELKEEMYDVDFSQEKIDELNAKRDRFDNLVMELKLQIKDIEGERQVIQKDLDRVPGVQKEIDSLQDDCSTIETAIMKFKELADLYLKTGRNIRARLIPQIETYFCWVLPKLTRGRYNRVRLGDDFDIKVFSDEYGDYVSLDVLSGGTVDQLLISLRLAFARATFSSSGPGSQFLFLDEPFSSFDESRREQFFNMLRLLTSNFAQIFLISHQTNLEDFVDYYFRLDLSDTKLPTATSWNQP